MRTEDYLKRIGLKVKELREQKGLTQFELACDINTDKSLISALERFKYRNITIGTLAKLSKVLDVEITYFLK